MMNIDIDVYKLVSVGSKVHIGIGICNGTLTSIGEWPNPIPSANEYVYLTDTLADSPGSWVAIHYSRLRNIQLVNNELYLDITEPLPN